MKTFYEKIKNIYPQLDDSEFHFQHGTIALVKEGNEERIAKWEHPTLAKPTKEQLA